ncbi:hypothetical protein [Streptomyces sp. bgisy022]|uniref:hypothetical protein n=1 Tax=Streptomyces sp. bgisy022 TaxID=3413769 RepID=UPI003D753931
MDTTQTQALIGMLFVLGLFALMILPAVFGIVRDRRIDRQIRQAETAPLPRRAPALRSVPADRSAPARSTAPHHTTRAA